MPGILYRRLYRIRLEQVSTMLSVYSFRHTSLEKHDGCADIIYIQQVDERHRGGTCQYLDAVSYNARFNQYSKVRYRTTPGGPVLCLSSHDSSGELCAARRALDIHRHDDPCLVERNAKYVSSKSELCSKYITPKNCALGVEPRTGRSGVVDAPGWRRSMVSCWR